MPKLTDKITGKGCNITCDNFFTSLPVAEKLARNKISTVGTIRKNRRELSSQMTQPLPDKIYHSRFMWHDRSNALFVAYQPKGKKSVYVFFQPCIPCQIWTLILVNKSQMLCYSITKIRLMLTISTRWLVSIQHDLLQNVGPILYEKIFLIWQQ